LFKRFTILTGFVLIASLSFVVRFVDVYHGVKVTLQKDAMAASEKKKDDHAAADEHGGEKGEEDLGTPEEEALRDKMSQMEGYEDRHLPGEDVEAVPSELDFDKVDGNKWRDANDEDFGFNSVRLEHLQDLEKRRQELEKRERALQTREALVQAAQQEMDRKQDELLEIRKKLENLLEEQSEEEAARIESLVKIYEGMKAKQAAEIFNTLDLDILVEVISRMSERKTSPILASMNPERARTVTIMLAEQKKLPTLPTAR
jgi:flagellar motility protein MotE (MotC chaperone)